MTSNRSVAGLLGLTLAGAGLAGCGGSSSGGAAADTTPSAVPSATSTAPVTPETGLPTPLASVPTLSAADVADHGLPSSIGPGKLSNAKIKALIQYFEDKVAKAYATGSSTALQHYLAGPMLSGNRATISLLSKQNKLNVFRIRVETVTPETNEKRHLIFDMTGDMVLDYFVDSRTHKVVNNGLPGPSQVQFAIFLDENPKTHTWYWTGEQSESTANSTTNGTVTEPAP